MRVDNQKLLQDMVVAARRVLKRRWPEVKEYAEGEFKKIAESISMIEKLKRAGKMTEEQARIHLDIQKNAARSVLLTVVGLGSVMVEQTINATLSAIKDAVNATLGWRLL